MSPKEKRNIDREFEAKMQAIRSGLARPLTSPPISRLTTEADIAGVQRAEESRRYREREEEQRKIERGLKAWQNTQQAASKAFGRTGFIGELPTAAYRVKAGLEGAGHTEEEQRHLELGRARMLAAQLAQLLAKLDSVMQSESAEFSVQGTHGIMDIVPMIRQTEHELDAILDKYRLRF